MFESALSHLWSLPLGGGAFSARVVSAAVDPWRRVAAVRSARVGRVGRFDQVLKEGEEVDRAVREVLESWISRPGLSLDGR